MSLRTRIGLLGGLVVFGVLAAAALLFYPAADRDLHDQLDGSLLNTAASAPTLAPRLKLEARSSNGATQPGGPLEVGDTLIEFVNGPLGRTGKKNPYSALAPISQQDLEVAGGQAPGYFQDVTYQDTEYVLYTGPYQLGSDSLIRVAQPESAATAQLDHLRTLLLVAVLAGAAGAAFAARLLAGRVLRPVRGLTETVEQVTRTGDLAARVQAAGRDEIGRLARSFAAMMAALDESVQAQQRLVADASHELRTPLTSLTTNLELLAEPGGLADPQAARLLAAASVQCRELRGLVNDLVDLGRYGEAAPHREAVRLDLLAERVLDRAKGRAPGRRFTADLAPCLIDADPDAIERAVGNLVDNAVKWSPEEGEIRVSVLVDPEASQGTVTVGDEGPGIPAADLPHVFDRFYRSASARSKPGSGLGLSIVRRIAELHGGSVAAHPLPRGTEMRLSLPLADEREGPRP
ncbi:MAG TPA: HAMP domain-containing sensor histidine kinase [Actinocrinis sp.]|jgi:two-component system sensor histidine kinase MprB